MRQTDTGAGARPRAARPRRARALIAVGAVIAASVGAIAPTSTAIAAEATHPNSDLGYPTFHGNANPVPDTGVNYDPTKSYLESVFDKDVAAGAGTDTDHDFWIDKMLARYGNQPSGQGTSGAGTYQYEGADNNSYLFTRGRAAYMYTHDPSVLGFGGQFAYWDVMPSGKPAFTVTAAEGDKTLTLTEDPAQRKQTPSYWKSVFTTSDPAITIVETKFITEQNVLVANIAVHNSGTDAKSITLTGTSSFATTPDGDELTGQAPVKNNLTTIYPRFSGNGFTPRNESLTQTLSVAASGAQTTKLQLGAITQELPDSTTEYQKIRAGDWKDPAAAYKGHVTEYNKWWADNIPYTQTPEQNIDKTVFYRWWLARYNMLDANMPGNTYQFPTAVEGALGYNNAIALTSGMFINDLKWLRDPSYAYGTWVSAGEVASGAQYRDNPGDPDNWNNTYTQYITDAGWQSYLVHGGPADIAESLGTYGKADVETLVGPQSRLNSKYNRNGNYLIDFDSGIYTGNDADAVSFYQHPGEAMDRAESAYIWSNATAAAQAFKAAGDTKQAKEMQDFASNVRSEILSELWNSSDKLMEHKWIDADDGSFAKYKEINNYLPYAVGLMPAAGDSDYTDNYESALRLFADADQYPVFPFFTANQADKAAAGNVGSNNFSIINSTVLFRIYQAAIRQYHSADHGYITPEQFKQLLYWNAFAHYQGGDNRYPDENEFWANGTANNGGEIDYRSWIHHTQLGTTNWTMIEDVAGMVARADDKIELDPIAIPGWGHFTVNNLSYHGQNVSIVWNEDGTYSNAPKGYSLYVGGKLAFTSDKLAHIVYDPNTGKATVQAGDETGATITYTAANANSVKAANAVTYTSENRVTDVFAKAGKNIDSAAKGIDGQSIAGNVDIAKGATVTSTSQADNATCAAKNAVDGSTADGSFWSPKGSGNASDSITVDFGAQRKIDDIRTYFYQTSSSATLPGYAEPSVYTLEYWDGSAWKTIPDQARTPVYPEANYNRVQFPVITTSKIRMTAMPQAGTSIGLKEIEAYGTGIKAPSTKNHAPYVDVRLGSVSPQGTTLVGKVTDDGLPNGTVSSKWSVVSAPDGATASFADPRAASTKVVVDQPGSYTLRLTANDGDLTTSKDVTFTVDAIVSGVNVAPDASSLTASFTTGWNNLEAVRDGQTFTGNTASNSQYWGTWAGDGSRPAQQWLEYDWATPQRLQGAAMAFFHDTDASAGTGAGVEVPKGWKLQYWDGNAGAWADVTLSADQSGYGTDPNATNTVSFNLVTTTKLRATFDARQGTDANAWYAAVGVTEFEALAEDPTSIEPIYAYVPSLPTTAQVQSSYPTVEAVYADGTRANRSVAWNAVPTSGETVSVLGTVQGANKPAKLTLTVGDSSGLLITGFSDIAVNTNVGVAPQLPSRAIAHYNNGSQESLPVTWADVPPSAYDGHQSTFTVTGTVTKGSTPYDVSATVTVLGQTPSGEGPKITGVSVADGAIVCGKATFRVDIGGNASDLQYTYIELNKGSSQVWVTDNTTKTAKSLGSTSTGLHPKLVVKTAKLADGDYGLKIDAKNKEGKTTEKKVSFTIHNGAPTAPSAVMVTTGDGVARVSWQPPASNGGSKITGYTVTAAPGGASCSADDDATSCRISGLTNGSVYRFSVVASNKVGNSPAATSAPATLAFPAGGSNVSIGLNAKAQCVSGRPTLAVYLQNKEKTAVDLRVTTPLGENKVSALAGGMSTYLRFPGTGTALDAGTGKVAAYTTVDGQAHYSTYQIAWDGIDCG